MTTQEFIESIRLEGEKWSPIAGYNNLYYVSTFGRVLSIRTQMVLKLVIQESRKRPYACVCLSIDGKASKKRVHRLVAETFLPNPCGYNEIDHIDNDGTNNNVSNLKWCDRAGNINNPHTLKNFRMHFRKIRGESGDLKDRYIAQIKDGEIIALYQTRKSLINAGFNDSRVYLVCNNKGKTHRGYEWAFIDEDSPLISMSKNS